MRCWAYSVVVAAPGYRRIAEDGALKIAAVEPAIVHLEPIMLDRQ